MSCTPKTVAQGSRLSAPPLGRDPKQLLNRWEVHGQDRARLILNNPSGFAQSMANQLVSTPAGSIPVATLALLIQTRLAPFASTFAVRSPDGTTRVDAKGYNSYVRGTTVSTAIDRLASHRHVHFDNVDQGAPALLEAAPETSSDERNALSKRLNSATGGALAVALHPALNSPNLDWSLVPCWLREVRDPKILDEVLVVAANHAKTMDDVHLLPALVGAQHARRQRSDCTLAAYFEVIQDTLGPYLKGPHVVELATDWLIAAGTVKNAKAHARHQERALAAIGTWDLDPSPTLMYYIVRTNRQLGKPGLAWSITVDDVDAMMTGWAVNGPDDCVPMGVHLSTVLADAVVRALVDQYPDGVPPDFDILDLATAIELLDKQQYALSDAGLVTLLVAVRDHRKRAEFWRRIGPLEMVRAISLRSAAWRVLLDWTNLSPPQLLNLVPQTCGVCRDEALITATMQRLDGFYEAGPMTDIRRIMQRQITPAANNKRAVAAGQT